MMLLYQDLSKEIIGAFFMVQKCLGPGLLEKNYHKALNITLRKIGLGVDYEYALPVYFDGIKVNNQ